MARTQPNRVQQPLIPFGDGLNDQLMATAAVRYCLGRRSYIVSSCHEWILINKSHFSRQTLSVVARDICEALLTDAAGDPQVDVPGWRRIATVLVEELTDTERLWLQGELQWRGGLEKALNGGT